MFKKQKNVLLGALSAALLLGGTALFNVQAADAAPWQVNGQQNAGYQAGMVRQGGQNWSNRFGAGVQEHFNQFNQNQNRQNSFYQQQPNQQQPNQQQPNQQQGRQLQCEGQISELIGGDIIEQIADILNVDEETIIDALKNGQTLVEIAEDYDMDEDELLDQLEELQTTAIENAIDDGKITEEQADAFLERLDEKLRDVVEGTHPGSFNWAHNTDNSDVSSVSDIEDELVDYFADAGDYYFGDDDIDMDISLSGDEDELVYKVTLDFSNAEDYDDLEDVSKTKVKSFLNALKSEINSIIEDTDFEGADITGKAIDNDNSSYYVKYNGSTYTFSWD